AAGADVLEGQALLVASVGKLVARRVVAQERVPGLYRVGVALLAVQALADPVLRVVGEVGVGIRAQVLLEALDGDVVVATRVIGVRLAIELPRCGRRCGGRRSWRARR